VDYTIAFAPDLGLSPQEFIAAWNSASARSDVGEAQLIDQPPQDFALDPELIQQGLVLLSGATGVAAGIGLEMLKDTVKDILAQYLKQKMSRTPSIRVETVRQPGGAYLLVVTGDDQ
jgi:hypothetical protein